MKKKSRFPYICAFLLFIIAIGALCYTGFSENSVYFLNVAEAKAADSKKLNKARLFGIVSGSVISRGDKTVSFNLSDKDTASLYLPVSYSGVIPDNFKEGAEVIVEGGMNGAGLFIAKTLMTKCPSKYQKENRQRQSAGSI